VVSNEEGVIRCDRAFVKNREGRFQLRRARRHLDEGTLLGISDQVPLARAKRQRDGIRCFRKGRCPTRRSQGRSAQTDTIQELPSIHG